MVGWFVDMVAMCWQHVKTGRDSQESQALGGLALICQLSHVAEVIMRLSCLYGGMNLAGGDEFRHKHVKFAQQIVNTAFLDACTMPISLVLHTHPIMTVPYSSSQ